MTYLMDVDIADSLIPSSSSSEPMPPGMWREKLGVVVARRSSVSNRDDAEAKKERQRVEQAWRVTVTAIAAELQDQLRAEGESVVRLSSLAQALEQAANRTEAVQIGESAIRLAISQWRSTRHWPVTATMASVQILARAAKHDLLVDLLGQLPNLESVVVASAASLVALNRLPEAVHTLSKVGSDQARALRGYVLAVSGRPAEAIAELRQIRGTLPGDSVTTYNLAICFWRLGSSKKAISAARQTTLLAPSNVAGWIQLVSYLIAARQFEDAHAEIDRFRRGQLVVTPTIRMLEGAVLVEDGHQTRGLTILRDAQMMAQRSNDSALLAHLGGMISVIEMQLGRKTKDNVRKELLALISRNPSNSGLLSNFISLCTSTTDAPALRQCLENADSSSVVPIVLARLSGRLAELELRFEDAFASARQWRQLDPSDDNASGWTLLLEGFVTGDWAAAAVSARAFIRKPNVSTYLANNAAYTLALGGYTLALGGYPREAMVALRRVSDHDFVIKATEGLAKIANGHISEGLAAYRTAAGLADENADSSMRVAMTAHQGIGLRTLGHTVDLPVNIRSSALPSVQLPDDWATIPMFQLLKYRCDREGWPWPPMID